LSTSQAQGLLQMTCAPVYSQVWFMASIMLHSQHTVTRKEQRRFFEERGKLWRQKESQQPYR
jgi:hypothetical protein